MVDVVQREQKLIEIFDLPFEFNRLINTVIIKNFYITKFILPYCYMKHMLFYEKYESHIFFTS